MHFITRKTLTWTTILFVAVLVTFIVNSFVTRLTVLDATIPPVLEADNERTPILDNGCDPLVFAMDAEGNVYSGRDRIGGLTTPLALSMKLKKVVEANVAHKPYAGGMDLNHEVPLQPCLEEPVYIRAVSDANDSRTLLLVKLLRGVGVDHIGFIKDKKKI